MTLKKQIIIRLSIVLTLFAIISILFIIRFTHIKFQIFEENYSNEIISLNLRSLKYELDTQSKMLIDWAIWDDTYQFAKDLNRSYIDSNLDIATITNLGIDGFLILDQNYNYRYAFTHSAESIRAKMIAEELRKYDKSIFSSPSTTFIKTDKGKEYAVNIHKILKSNSSGDDVGFLIFFEDLHKILTKTMSQITGYQYVLNHHYNMKKPEHVFLEKSISYSFKNLDIDTIQTDVFFENPNGEYISSYSFHIKRNLHAYLIKTMKEFIVLLIIVPLIGVIIIISLISKTVINPIKEISKNAEKMYREQNLVANLPVVGCQEIQVISKNINALYQNLNVQIINNIIQQYFQEMTNEKLKNLSEIDELTGMYNRRYFNEYYEKIWKASTRNKKPLSILMIDIDSFKQFNDTYGHVDGDVVLSIVSKIIKTTVNRPLDIPARYGGEEFIVILPETDLDGAVFLAKKIKDAVEKRNIQHTSSEFGILTVSVGIASIIPDIHINSIELINASDKALYNSKKQGRNKISLQDLT